MQVIVRSQHLQVVPRRVWYQVVMDEGQCSFELYPQLPVVVNVDAATKEEVNDPLLKNRGRHGGFSL